MLRSKGLTNKLLVLGLDGMDPRFSKAMVDAGKMPNLKKLIEMGSAREDLECWALCLPLHRHCGQHWQQAATQ